MKKVVNIIWGIWCVFACSFSPLWIAMIYLNMTGLIYKYDYSMDEGTAIIIGLVLLMLWLGLVAFPVAALVKRLYKRDKKYLLVSIILIIAFCTVGVVVSGGNPVTFLIS